MAWQTMPKRKKKKTILTSIFLAIIIIISFHLWLLTTQDAVASFASIETISFLLKASGYDVNQKLLLSGAKKMRSCE